MGTDVQVVSDVQNALDVFGASYCSRVYTPHEQESCGGSAAGLAARFAVKEAVLKILRVDGAGPDLREIEVVRSASGSCSLRLVNQAAQRAEVCGLTNWDISLSHSGPIATATVVAVRRPTGLSTRRSS